MENSQVITIIASILGPMLVICSIGFSYLIKHSKDLGLLEGVLMKELKLRIKEKK
jgi:hypothetical protein